MDTNEENELTVSEYLQEMLNRHPGLSMRQASLTAGLNTNAVQQIINSGSRPRPDTLKALADTWGTPEDYIMLMKLSGYAIPETVDIGGLSPLKRHVISLLAQDNVPESLTAFIAAGLEQFLKEQGEDRMD